MDVYNLDNTWVGKHGEFVSFAKTETALRNALENPWQVSNDGAFVFRLPDANWKALVAFAQSLDRVVPPAFGAEAPPAQNFFVLSPSGRKGGTWAIVRVSTRNSSVFDVVMPDVGSRETAYALLAVLNKTEEASTRIKPTR